jgi:GT2 family glycosyltransferase
MHPTMTAVVPTRNRPQAVLRAVESLQASGRFAEIVVVDDGSDEPVAPTPGVAIVRHDRPRLLAAARNAGAARATSEIIFFIDDDCVVDVATIGRLADALARDERLAMVGPTIAYLDEPDRIWCAGVGRGRWTGRTRLRGAGLPVREAASLPRESDDFPSAFAVRRSCFEEIGGFDVDGFPGHMTEASLGDLLRGAGYGVELVPDSLVWHQIDADASLLRRLHVDSGERAFRVAADRTRYIVTRDAGRAERATAFAFWAGVLVPVYLLAILRDRKRGIAERLRLTVSLLRGVAAGARAE